MKPFVPIAALLSLPLLIAATQAEPEESLSRWKANMARHQQVLMHGVPAPYDGLRDPLPDNRDKLRRGAAIFDRQCSACHGWSGRGTGPEGFFLVPAPADLEWLAGTPKDRSEPYIYWTVAEGGKAVDSEMPAYKKTLSAEDIWAVAAYVRAGMPYATP